MKYCLLMLLLCLPTAAAQAYYAAQELTIDLNISNTLTVQPTRSGSDLRRAEVSLAFYPRDDFRQTVERIAAYPEMTYSDGNMVFGWSRPKGTTLDFWVSSRILTVNELPFIRDPVPFPSEVEPELQEYLAQTPTIDYGDSRISALADELAAGETDLYLVTHKLAAWVNENIKYDLNTKTAEASQSASWVMTNREGVCDEITNLFIGLCRSLGIPARFISGLSYSTSDLFSEPWSPHGWAEVYFPGYGWIPFDVTYGEFGYIDPGHIKLKDSLDANKSSTRYEWEGYNVDLDAGRLSMKADVVGSHGTWDQLVSLKARILKPEVGFGSYNLLEVKIENPHDYYVPVELYLSQNQELELDEEPHRFILLNPDAEKTEYWIMRIAPDLNPRFMYNFTVQAYTIRNASSAASFAAGERFHEYSLHDMKTYVENRREEESKVFSASIALNCMPEKPVYYTGEAVLINCSVRNAGNVALDGVSLCLDNGCAQMDLGIGSTVTHVLSEDALETGMQTRTVVASSADLTKSAEVSYDVWDLPAVRIGSISYPGHVLLSDAFTIEFKVSPETSSVPQNVTVQLSSGSFEKDWSLDDLPDERKYILNVGPNSLSEIDNPFTISVSYVDKLGKGYKSVESFTVSLRDVSLLQRLIMLLNKINMRLKYDMVLAVITVFVAGIVVGVILKPGHRHKRLT